MLLLHISDIHFRAPDCLTPDLDPDRPFRTRMIQDVRAMVAELGPVGAILIGGDIAFKGDPQEYTAAFEWINALAGVCNCPLERVFVVPGNHDIDRSVIARTPAARNAQAAIARAEPRSRERELRAQFMDLDTGRALLAPLAAYNNFAKLFNCQVYPPEHLYWKQDLPLDGGVHIRIHGLTSTLLSGSGGRDDTRDSLYLSPLQTVLDPVDDVVNLVICHHPPDWLMDQDEVEDAVCGRAMIHLFGHKHRQRIAKDDGYIRFSAGAVNPDRYESGWQPGYNLVKVGVAGSGRDRVLKVEAHLRQWQSNPDQYRPMLTQLGDPVFRHLLPIPDNQAGTKANKAPSAFVGGGGMAGVNNEETEVDVEVAMSDENTRNLIFRFWSLTVSQRREISLGLGLIDKEDLKLPEPERYGRALRRASELNLLDKLAREVAQRETH